MYKIPITFQKESVFPVQRGVSACSPSVYVCLPVRKHWQRCDAETVRASAAALTRAYLIYIPSPTGRPKYRRITFLRLGAKKLGKTFGAKKIMSTFAPVSEILLLTDTDEAHKSGSVGTIRANTRVAKWGRL